MPTSRLVNFAHVIRFLVVSLRHVKAICLSFHRQSFFKALQPEQLEMMPLESVWAFDKEQTSMFSDSTMEAYEQKLDAVIDSDDHDNQAPTCKHATNSDRACRGIREDLILCGGAKMCFH